MRVARAAMTTSLTSPAVELGLSRAKIVTEFDLPDTHHAIKKHHQATGDSLPRQPVALTRFCDLGRDCTPKSNQTPFGKVK
jgi:hypothetical protein